MKRPTKARICGWPWKVTWTDHDDFLGDHLGVCVYGERRIVIRCSNIYHREVLLHEILHAVWWETGLPEEGGCIDGLLGESVVQRLATGLMRTMVDSPQVVRYLLEEA